MTSARKAALLRFLILIWFGFTVKLDNPNQIFGALAIVEILVATAPLEIEVSRAAGQDRSATHNNNP